MCWVLIQLAYKDLVTSKILTRISSLLTPFAKELRFKNAELRVEK